MKTTLFYNGICHSMKAQDDVFAAFTVSDGRIAHVYKADEAAKLQLSDFKDKVDLQGKHVYPCLIDGHTHMLLTIAVMAMGFNACEITKTGVEPHTIAGVEARVRDYAARQKANAVIAINNYICTAIDERRMPSREELDDWGGGRAMVIYNIDGHSTSLSSAMLKKIGIDPDGHSGVLTGEDNERAQGRIIDVVGGAISLPTLARGIANFHNYCAEYGISVVGALEGNGDSEKDTTTKLIIRLARHFGVGVRLYLQYTDLDRVAPYAKLMKHKRLGGCGDWEMDGASGSHSAAFAEPYTDTGKTAPCYYDRETVDRFCARAEAQGYQIASHAIGDLAIRQLVDAYDKLESKTLHRIEHAEFADDETFRRICEGNYAIMAQPGYSWIDKRYLHTYEQVLSQEIRDRMKFKSYYDAGVLICGSSDSPVQDMDPYLQMLGMVQFYNEQESLTPYEALTTYTVNAAKALLEGDERGTLEVGKVADFFTADADFCALSPEEVVSFRPAQTYYEGKAYRPMKGTVGNLVRIMLNRPKLI